MKNEIIFDAAGRPDIVVTYTAEELTEALGADHPVLTVKGRKISELCVGKYPATLIEGVPYSLPFQKPAGRMTFDEMVAACEAKGDGWHLFTAAEWAAIALISRKNGTLPHGNTNCGRYHADKNETGITYDGLALTLTGSGPVTWTHTHTAEGIHDLCGNQYERIGGLRFMDGAIQIIRDNDAAGHVDQSKRSPAWEPVLSDGKPVKYKIEDETLVLTTDDDIKERWDGCRFRDILSETEVPEILEQLALYPEEPETLGDDYAWIDTDGERLGFRGGDWSSGASAGVFYLYGYVPRSFVDPHLGFRPAFVRFSDLCSSDTPNGEEGKA